MFNEVLNMKYVEKIVKICLITILFFSVINLVSAEEVIYQNRVVDRDAYIDEFYSDTNQVWGTNGLRVGTGNSYPKDIRSLLWFDLSTLPNNINIVNAKLSLYVVGWGASPQGRTYVVYPLVSNRSWIENEVTWNRYLSGNLWDNPGGDYNVVPSASAVLPYTLPVWVTWDVTDILRYQRMLGEDFSVLVKDSVENYEPRSSVDFVHKETSMWFGYQPKLVIVYEDSPITVVSPDGGENLVRGTTHTIRWSSSITERFVRINLLKNGVKILTIKQNTSNDGVYNWKVPRSLSYGNDYKIKIYSGIYNDESNSNFVIS